MLKALLETEGLFYLKICGNFHRKNVKYLFLNSDMSEYFNMFLQYNDETGILSIIFHALGHPNLLYPRFFQLTAKPFRKQASAT